jgi:hypothetical protein
MQTFLPYESYKKSAAVLDNKRLGKQRVETLQIMKALVLPEYGWKNHPAVKMWEKCEVSLMTYQIAICDEWTRRGFKDTCKNKTLDILIKHMPYHLPAPFWCMDERVFASHRSNLLRKDPEWYGQFGWTEPDDLEYFWPTKEEVNV